MKMTEHLTAPGHSPQQPHDSISRYHCQGEPPGLSIAHNPPTYSLTHAAGSQYTRVRHIYGGESQEGRHKGGRRGRVVGFSGASRSRLCASIMSVDRTARPEKPWFVTVTYPGDWPRDPERWHAHLEALGKRILRRWPDAFAYWKLEPQKRGAPHFHLMLWGPKRKARAWLAKAWYEIVGSGDGRHYRAGTQWDRAKSWSKARSYVAKYMAKPAVPEDWCNPGRWWGIFGRANRPETIVEIHLTESEYIQVRRILRRLLGPKKRRQRWYAGALAGLWAICSDECYLKMVEHLELAVSPEILGPLRAGLAPPVGRVLPG